MMKLRQFTEIETDIVAWINPLLVRIVKPLPDGGTAIVFDKDHKLNVSQELDEVLKALKSKDPLLDV